MRFFGDRRGGDLRRSIEQLENAFAGGHGGLQDVVFVAEVLNRAEKTLRVAHEGDQDAQRGDCGDGVNHGQMVNKL